MLLCAAAMACSEKEESEPVYTSDLQPSFSYDVEGDIVAGETYINFENTTEVKGTDVERYFWHFGFSGKGTGPRMPILILSCTRLRESTRSN